MGGFPRLIPAVIVVAVLVLGLRIGDLWQHAGTAMAQQAKPAAPAAAAAPPAAPASPPAQAEPRQAATAPAAPKPSPEPASLDDPANLTPAELEVLQSLAGRRVALEQRTADLDRREALLKAAEGRIEAKIQELKALQASIESALLKYDEQEEGRRRSLIKIYETMKPKDAAKIFEQMELPVLLDIVEGMKEAKVAPILAEMNPVRAKQVTGELAKRKQPKAGG